MPYYRLIVKTKNGDSFEGPLQPYSSEKEALDDLEVFGYELLLHDSKDLILIGTDYIKVENIDSFGIEQDLPYAFNSSNSYWNSDGDFVVSRQFALFYLGVSP